MDFNDPSFWDILLWSFWIFIWIAAIMIWFRCVFDMFSDHTLSGVGKFGWRWSSSSSRGWVRSST